MSKTLEQGKNLLAVPKSFIDTAMSFPEKVDRALALIDTREAAEELLSKADAMAHYAKRIKVDNQVVKYILQGRLKIVGKVGELMPATSPNQRGAKGGRGKKAPKPTLGAFSDPTLSAYRKVAAHRDKLAAYFAAVMNDEDAEVSTAGFIRFVNADGIIATKHNNNVVDWYTPEKYIELARAVMGSIDLDPASNSFAQKIVKAGCFHSKSDNGLKHDWAGTVFLNPPFKMPLVEQFVFKLCDSFESKSVTQAILLTNNNTDTKWWQRAAACASAICFTAGRISFYNKAGDKSQPTNGQTFCYFGNRVEKFAKEFAGIGLCLSK